MADTRGRQISTPWYQHEPFPAVVEVLLDHRLLAEGGTASLRLASRVAAASTVDVGDRHAAIMGALVREQLVEDRLVAASKAAQAILDVLLAHEAAA